MRHLRLALPALAMIAAGAWYSQGSACDDSKSARTAASGSTACSAQQAAHCTAEQAATCKARRASAVSASASSCASRTSSFTASTSAHCSAKTSAAAYAASANGCNSSASAGQSCAHGVTTSASKGASCPYHGAAVTTSNGETCAAHQDKLTALGSGSCSGRGMTTLAARSAHGDCDACADMTLCYEELEAAGTRTQVVPLKNGVMFVYTAETPGSVSAVQSAMARRNERLSKIVAMGDRAHLCPECKSIRGAVASGKMTREVVNIEGGVLTLMTSNDPTVVAKIHGMVENHKGGRFKI